MHHPQTHYEQHHHHHTRHPQHNVSLNIKDLECSLAQNASESLNERSKYNSNNRSEPEEYQKALLKLSSKFKGTKYENALNRLLQEKSVDEGPFVNTEFESTEPSCPSPEKVSHDVENVQIGRMVTSSLLDSYVDVPVVHATNIDSLSKPYDKNKYIKKRDVTFIATNHLGRQRPPREVAGIDNDGTLDKTKNRVMELHSPKKDQSYKALLKKMPLDESDVLPPTMNSSMHGNDANGNGNTSMSVSLSDFQSWINTNSQWHNDAVSKQSQRRSNADIHEKVNSNPKLFKQPSYLKNIYAEKLKQYQDGKRSELLKSCIQETEAQTQRGSSMRRISRDPADECTFTPRINKKSKRIVQKRDATQAREYDVKHKFPYEGPTLAYPITRESVPFVGLQGNEEKTEVKYIEDGGSESDNQVSNTDDQEVDGDHNDENKENSSNVVVTIMNSNTTPTKSQRKQDDSIKPTNLQTSPSRYNSMQTSTPERRSRSLSPRMAYSADRNTNRRSCSPVSFGRSSYRQQDNLLQNEEAEGNGAGRSLSVDRGRRMTVHTIADHVPRVSGANFSSSRRYIGQNPPQSYYRSPKEPREVKDFQYMTAESKRIMSANKSSFADRVMADIEKYYTANGVQKALRTNLLGSNNNNAVLASSSYGNKALTATGGVHGAVQTSLLGPGQYNKTEVHGSRGVSSRHATGARGYSFSQLPRTANVPVTLQTKKSSRKKDWKTDFAKSGAPIYAQLSNG